MGLRRRRSRVLIDPPAVQGSAASRKKELTPGDQIIVAKGDLRGLEGSVVSIDKDQGRLLRPCRVPAC